MVELVSGEVGEDLAYYFKQSYQVPSIVALSTIPSENGCELSAGYIVELMPGYTQETLAQVEAVAGLVAPISKMVRDGALAGDLVADYLVNFKFDQLTHPHQLYYSCDCDVERIENAIRTLGKEEIKSMISENKIFDVGCRFCGKNYQVNPIQLQRVLAGI